MTTTKTITVDNVKYTIVFGEHLNVLAIYETKQVWNKEGAPNLMLSKKLERIIELAKK